MKLRLLLVTFITVLLGLTTYGQLTVDNSMTVTELVNNVLLGQGVTATNVTYNGVDGDLITLQAGTFNSENSNIPIGQGVIMTTGSNDVAIGPNDLGSANGNNGSDGLTNDPDLMQAVGGTFVFDCAIIEFDFVAAADSLKFNYVFASEEYNEWVCGTVNDVFGFFLSGGTINGPYSNNAINIALIPNTDIPVTINTVNNGTVGLNGSLSNCTNFSEEWDQNTEFYIDNENNNDPNSTQFDGFTTVLTALADIDCGETYHIKLAIADVSDGGYDSGVFLEAGSFAAFGDVFVNVSPTIGGSAVTNPLYDSVLVAGCSEAAIELTRPSGLTIDSVYVEFGGTAIQQTGDSPIPGADYILSNEEDSINLSFPEGVDTINFVLNTIWDQIPNENEYIVISIFYYDACDSLRQASDTIYIVDPYFLSSSATGAVVTCPAETVTVSAQGLEGIEPYFYDWGDFGSGLEMDEANVDVPADSAYYMVSISDACAFENKFDSVLVVNNIPDPLQATIDPFTDPECPNEPINLNASIQDGNGDYTIIWQNGNGGGYPALESITVANVNSTLIYDAGNPEPINFKDNLPIYLTVIDTCGTIVRDTVGINYPYFAPLSASFNKLTDNCPKDAVELRASTENGAGQFEYNWSMTKGSFAAGADPKGEITYVLPDGGMNVYTLTVTDFCSRQGYDFRYIVGESELASSGIAIYEDSLRVIKLDNIMNVITPNGKNNNDYFVVEGVEEFEDARLDVFDRWGKLVYGTDNYTAGDITIRPADVFDADGLKDGTYFYVINIDSGECVQTGTIEVLRGNN